MGNILKNYGLLVYCVNFILYCLELTLLTVGVISAYSVKSNENLIGLSTSALADLTGSGSGGQLVYFGLTQICRNICIQVLAPTGQVPVKCRA